MAETRFLIYAQERTGSNLLVDLLNHQPKITCDAELLAKRRPLQGRADRLRHRARTLTTHSRMAWRAHRAPTHAYGFKLLVYQVERPGRWSPRSFHARGWQILNLRRRSVWHQALSNLLAKHARRWRRYEGDPAPLPPPALSWASLTQELDYLLHQSALEARDLQGLSCLSLTYEEDLKLADAWPTTLAKVWAHLGMPAAPAPAQTTMARTHDDPLERVIPNYLDLLEAAARSPHAHLPDTS